MVIEETYIDHLGNKYGSLREMCKAYKITIPVFRSRMRHGWTLEEALMSVRVSDEQGNMFKSINEMCEHYNIPYHVFMYRTRNLGWSVKDALTTEYVKKKTALPITKTDHKGHIFDSITDKCKAYGISTSLYRDRIRDGWSEEDALTTPVKVYKHGECTDHKGNVFHSLPEMCRFYGIEDPKKYRNRLKLGWSQEKALTTPFRKMVYKREPVTDHIGNPFPTKKAMCTHYGITVNHYLFRIKQGWSLEKALTTPVRKYEK